MSEIPDGIWESNGDATPEQAEALRQYLADGTITGGWVTHYEKDGKVLIRILSMNWLWKPFDDRHRRSLR